MLRVRAFNVFGLFVWSCALFSGYGAAAAADEPKPSFQITKNHIDRVVRRDEPDVEFVAVQNTGKIIIREITYEGEFTDAKSGVSILIAPTAADLPKDGIPPSNQFSIKVKMCRPVSAGSYSGALVLTSPGADSKSVGVVIRSRGPLPNVPFGKSTFYELPVILFVVVVLIGFGVSWLLDKWMGTDLPRLRALQSLRNSQTMTLSMSERVRRWPIDHPSLFAFPLTMNRMAILVPDLARVIVGANQATPTDLAAAGQTYSLISGKLLVLSSALDLIESLYSQKGNEPLNLANLNSAIKRLDALDFSDASPIATFRGNVVNALSVANASASEVSTTAPAAPNTAVAQTVQVEGTQKQIERDIWFITLAQHAVVWVVVVLTGLTTYFLANATYGTAGDYIGTLLWSLGLTQTGKQIIARPR